MPEQTYLIFDLGASNVRALAGRFNGKTVSFKEVYRFDNRPVMAAGTLYWDLLFLFSQLEIGIGKAVDECGEIKSIGIDTWGCDFGFIDKRGKLLSNPVNYRDARRHAVSEELFALVDREKLFGSTGIFQLSIMSIFNLFAMKLDNAAELQSADKFLMMPDLLNYLLTGEITNDYTDATTTCLYNPESNKWESWVLDALGIDKNLFSDTILPGTKIGPLQKSICEELDLPAIPVTSVAGHDTASAFTGIPVIDNNKKWAFLSLGTWGVMGAETSSPLLTTEILNAGIGNEGNADGRTFLARNITGLWITQECREAWIRENRSNISFQEIVAAAEKAGPFQGIIDVDDPLFGQVQPHMPDTVISSCRRDGFSVSEDIGSVARIVYESLVMKFYEVLLQIVGYIGYEFELLHIIGGGTKNRLLCQWTADITGLPVIAGPAETTAAGNLIAQLVGSGEIESFQAGREIVRASFETIVYQPAKRQEWLDAYKNFKKVAG
jgi:rhamnulokinase